MTVADEPTPRWGLPAALSLSIAAHVIVLLLSLWLPLPIDGATPALPDETVLRFQFAQPSTRTELNEPPRGEVPDVPRPAARARPAAAPATPNAGRTPQPSPTPSSEPTGARGIPDGEALPDTSLPRDDSGDVQGGPTRRGDLAENDRGFDVGRALESFGRALSSRPRVEPTFAAPGPGVAASEFRPELSELPSTGFGVGNLVFETKDFDWNDYARQIYNAIWRAWHQRLYVTTDDFEKVAHATGDWFLNDQVAVRFTIGRSGAVTGIAVEAPSGWVPLDLSATDALAEVILPPLPNAFPKPAETVHARFIAIGEVRALRPHLRRFKQAGYF